MAREACIRVGLAQAAAVRAYKLAGIGPADVDLAEIHDSTSFCEIEQIELLGLCDPGHGGPFTMSGATSPTCKDTGLVVPIRLTVS